MFKSELKIWSYSPNADLIKKGPPYSDLKLTGEHVVNFEFRPDSTFAIMCKITEGKTEMLQRFTLTNIPLIFNAIRSGKIADDYSRSFLLDFLHKQVLSGEETEFVKQFRNFWPEYLAFYEGERDTLQRVANARQAAAAKQVEPDAPVN